MLKEKLLSMSIFSLAISMIISASIVTKGMRNHGEYVSGGLGAIGTGLNHISNNIDAHRNNQESPKDNYDFLKHLYI